MGKKIYIKANSTVVNQQYCKNCGAPLTRKPKEGYFCCMQCARNYALMHNTIESKRPNFNTNELPYKSYR